MTVTSPPAPAAEGAPSALRPILFGGLALLALAAVVAGVLAVTHRGGPPALGVSEAAATEGTDAASVYLTVTNAGGADDLMAVTTPAASSAVLHGTAADGAMTGGATGLAVPAGGSLRLRPGGNHLMLSGLRQPLTPGASIPLHLTFRRGGSIDTDATVVAYADVLARFPTTTGDAP